MNYEAQLKVEAIKKGMRQETSEEYERKAFQDCDIVRDWRAPESCQASQPLIACLPFIPVLLQPYQGMTCLGVVIVGEAGSHGNEEKFNIPVHAMPRHTSPLAGMERAHTILKRVMRMKSTSKPRPARRNPMTAPERKAA
jgi:hypothetical protein